MTPADPRRGYFLGVLRGRFPDLLPLFEQLYPTGSHGAVRSGDHHTIGRRIRELCRQHGTSDQMPRQIAKAGILTASSMTLAALLDTERVRVHNMDVVAAASQAGLRAGHLALPPSLA